MYKEIKTMKRIIIILSVLLMMSACAAFEETYYVDREFGLASQAAFDNQIANGENQVADDPPEGVVDDPPKGLEGINAERMMAAHNEAFGKSPQETNVFNISLTK